MTDETQFGPKMRLLTPKQRAFVIAFVEGGNQNYVDAFNKAGYAFDQTGGNASRVANTPKVQAAILEETSSRLHAMAPVALATVLKIATTENHKDQFSAAKHILAATGFNQRQSIDVTHGGTVEIGYNEFMAQVQIIRQAGLTRLPAPIDITPDQENGRNGNTTYIPILPNLDEPE